MKYASGVTLVWFTSGVVAVAVPAPDALLVSGPTARDMMTPSTTNYAIGQHRPSTQLEGTTTTYAMKEQSQGLTVD
ncbi:hypothetical protein PGT21_015596 [Puccinia graminis f. sp. tritici]|uniref:Uncharacterized protein n=1 Tax=Puccinia graminis f. sp. tritici TaxID=56615 RepID=A0A5B0MRA6_PUCGR|nr:hypothetical protein PGT21_015596 [Puccinia graminis f. sp. tritici]